MDIICGKDMVSALRAFDLQSKSEYMLKANFKWTDIQ